MTLLSTTADVDLSLENNDLVRFTRELPGIPEETYLGFKNKWFIGSKSGCSCELRHLSIPSVELGFGLPEDWFPEEQSDIEATRQIIASIRSLIENGANVDCVDAWSQYQTVAVPLAGEVEVNLATVSNEAFRFFEMHKFVFSSTQHTQPPA